MTKPNYYAITDAKIELEIEAETMKEEIFPEDDDYLGEME